MRKKENFFWWLITSFILMNFCITTCYNAVDGHVRPSSPIPIPRAIERKKSLLSTFTPRMQMILVNNAMRSCGYKHGDKYSDLYYYNMYGQSPYAFFRDQVEKNLQAEYMRDLVIYSMGVVSFCICNVDLEALRKLKGVNKLIFVNCDFRTADVLSICSLNAECFEFTHCLMDESFLSTLRLYKKITIT